MGVKLPTSVDQWLVDNGMMPPELLTTRAGSKKTKSRADHTAAATAAAATAAAAATDSVASGPYTHETVALAAVDLDTIIRRLLCQFKPGESLEPYKIIGRFATLIQRWLLYRRTVLTFDMRRDIPVPRKEVGSERYGEVPAESSDASPAYERMAFMDPLSVEARDKIGFRCFLARGIASMVANNSRGIYRCCSSFAVMAPDNTIHGTPSFCHVIGPALAHTEGDTRIPAAVQLLLQHGIIRSTDEILVATNDFDIMWLPCLADVRAIHYCRPDLASATPRKLNSQEPAQKATKEKIPSITLDLVKMRKTVEQRYKHGYAGWLFWIYLFHKNDYSTPPPGLSGMYAYSPLHFVFSYTDTSVQASFLLPATATSAKALVAPTNTACKQINRRVLRSILFAFPPEEWPALLRHFARVTWSCAFYLLLRPDWRQFGWTDTPFEWDEKDALQLTVPIDATDSGVIEIAIQART